ncbi:MAG TPA: hypothetical protein VJ837_01535, partial [Candidatus Paceibacterota bacterium]|nr:hypothetical protein [Candidatus Paceibacterota bacterium]
VTFDFPVLSAELFVPGGPGMVGGRVVLRLLAAGDDVRPMLDARDGQPGARVSLIAAVAQVLCRARCQRLHKDRAGPDRRLPCSGPLALARAPHLLETSLRGVFAVGDLLAFCQQGKTTSTEGPRRNAHEPLSGKGIASGVALNRIEIRVKGS